MERIFSEAHSKRRNREYVLTSRYTNAIHYGSPAYARKRDIWPPMSQNPRLLKGIDEESRRPAESAERVGEIAPAKRSSHHQCPSELKEMSARKDNIYQPLHDGDTIRVLELKPGLFHDPIVCDFHYANLRQLHLEYTALSYVWGDQKKSYFDAEAQTWKEKIGNATCNGHKREITPNLELALQHTRSPSESVFLWADALCINQDDVRERGHQVTLMGSVYRNAHKVLIWVTEKDDRGIWDETSGKIRPTPAEFEDVRAQRAFGAICDIVNHWQGHTEKPTTYGIYNRSDGGKNSFTTFEEYPFSARQSQYSEHMHKFIESRYPRRQIRDRYGGRSGYMQFQEAKEEGESKPPDAGLEADESSAPTSPFWMSVADLFRLSWFWRVWVVQEAVLAQKAVVKWADAEIEWRWVGLAAAILRTTYRPICEKMEIGGVYNAYLMYRLSPMSDLRSPRLSFTQLLRLTRQFEVTDPRDRIYGLLGMETDGNEPETGSLFLPPDYSITVAKLWKRLAWKMIHDSQRLSILSSVQYSTDQYESENAVGQRNYRRCEDRWKQKLGEAIPSWVPHWEIVYRTTLAAWDVNDTFAAAEGLPLKLYEQQVSTNVLCVEGIESGVVGLMGRYMWHSIDTGFLKSHGLASFFTTEIGLRLLGQTLTAGRDAYGSLAKSSDSTLHDFAAYLIGLHDRALEQERELENFSAFTHAPLDIQAASLVDIFGRFADFEKSLRSWANPGDFSRFETTATSICERRRLFLTLNGFLGLAPDTVEGGDVVAVLSGGDVPYLLRPVKEGTEFATDPKDEASSQVNASGKRYLLVGECYVQDLMNGEAVRAQPSKELVGPVPTNLIHEEIITIGNKPETVVHQGLVNEMIRTKEKDERLRRRELFTFDLLEQHSCVRASKTRFNIW